MTTNLQIIGNAALLDLPDKVAFLSSRKISAADVMKCYEWAEKVRNGDRCIVSGFQSPLEKDVLKFLLRGKAPLILVLARKLWKGHKTGYKRNVTHVSPKTNFTVKFPDGKVIADSKAFRVMAKAIEAMGADKVAALGVLCGGEPLVTQDKSQLKKHPSAVAEIAGGWFVKTHSGTAAKINYIKRIAKALKIKLVVAKV